MGHEIEKSISLKNSSGNSMEFSIKYVYDRTQEVYYTECSDLFFNPTILSIVFEKTLTILLTLLLLIII